MQSIILYFIIKYPEQKKFAPSLLKTMYDEEVLDQDFFMDFLIKWHKKKKKLDKESVLYDRKAEKAFRELIKEFIEWLE